MLRLTQQVGGCHFSITSCLVADHQGLSGAGQQVDTHAPEQLTLGLRDIGVAGPDNHVDAGNALGTDGHRTNSLYTAKAVDFIRTEGLTLRTLTEAASRKNVEGGVKRGTVEAKFKATLFMLEGIHAGT